MINQSAVAPSVAPLDPREVARAYAPFGSSHMLPRAAYVDQEILDWERQTVFADWLCLGRSEEIPEPKMTKSYNIGTYGVLVSRAEDGTLRAFENACRHRGHELMACGAEAKGDQNITCPYHGWVYTHEGKMLGAPGFKRYENFDRAQYGLMEMPCREWHGWIFANPNRVAQPFEDHVGALEDVLSHYDADTLVTAEVHQYHVAANWKTIIENYQECYHCALIHPQLVQISPPSSGENLDLPGNWVGGNMLLVPGAETMSLTGDSLGTVIARLDEEEKQSVMYVAVMPNLLISMHPDYIMTHLLFPVSPGLTRVTCSWAFPPAAFERDGFDPSYAVEFWDITNKQDWAACEGVQRGIQAPNWIPGPLAPAEDGVYNFVSLMARRYAGEAPVPAHA